MELTVSSATNSMLFTVFYVQKEFRRAVFLTMASFDQQPTHVHFLFASSHRLENSALRVSSLFKPGKSVASTIDVSDILFVSWSHIMLLSIHTLSSQ